MLRKLIFVVCAVALTLASCGRQVTPNRTTSPTGLTAGQMQIKFTTQGQADFVNNIYVLAFNTSGTGTEPYAINANQTNNWLNLSFEILIFQPNASSPVQAQVWQFVSSQGPNGPLKTPRILTGILPQDLIITPNCNMQTTFCVTINRRIFTNAFCPQTSPPAGGSACVANTWFINWFVASPGGTPPGQLISSAGDFGVTDTTFVKQYDITTNFDFPWTQALPPAVPQAPSQASQITGGEVLNVP
jgi:hypothetical protein